MSRSSLAVLAAAVLVSAGAVAYAGGSPPDEVHGSTRTPAEVETTRATLACPPSPHAKSTHTSFFATSPVVRTAGGGEPGVLVTSVLSNGPAQPLDSVDVPGRVVERPVTAADEPSLLVSAAGPMSAGATAALWSVETGKSSSGASAAWCQAGADDWWFTGVSTSVGATSDVVLTNSTPAIAVADLRFFGPDGAVEAAGERGIAVAPNSQQVLALGRFAPGLDALTVNVHATTGRLTAALSTSLRSGVTPAGTEWIPAGADPSDHVLVDAGLGGADAQTLQVTNPGEREALVEVQVVGASGAFTPSGLDSVRVAPGAVVSEELTDVVDKEASAVLLSSTVPVTGAIVSTVSRPNDVAVSAPSPVVAAPAVVPVIDDTDLEIAFSSAVRKGGAVQIDGFAENGQSTLGETFNLAGQTTTTWTPGQKDQSAYYVITVTVDGETQATAQYSGDDGITTLPVLSGSYTVSRPDVRPAR
jgi:hypothetical protein